MKHIGIIIAFCSILILAVTGVTVYVVVSQKNTEAVNNEIIETVTTAQSEASTNEVATQTVIATEKTEIQTSVQTTAEKQITTSQVMTTGFFNVVTSGGTVSSDDSLSGLSGDSLKLGKIILAAGFRYDAKQQIFYSDKYSWQRNFGFTPIYDIGATLGGMYYDTIRLKFTYGDYDYMYQLWKGRYGITTGGEMGLYYKKTGTSDIMYACVPDEEMHTMSFALYRNDEIYMLRGPEKHWWLTGFKIFDVAAPSELSMHCTYFLEDTGIADALEKAIIDYGFIKNVNYQRVQNRITIVWK